MLNLLYIELGCQLDSGFIIWVSWVSQIHRKQTDFRFFWGFQGHHTNWGNASIEAIRGIWHHFCFDLVFTKYLTFCNKKNGLKVKAWWNRKIHLSYNFWFWVMYIQSQTFFERNLKWTNIWSKQELLKGDAMN